MNRRELAKEKGTIARSLRYLAGDGEYETPKWIGWDFECQPGDYLRPPRSSNPKNKPAAAEIRIAWPGFLRA
jgi:hypothetical protein